MSPQGPNQQSHIDQFSTTMLNLVYNFTSIFTVLVEMILRPQYGSRYFPPLIMALSAGLMMGLPVASELSDSFSHMIPFVRFRGPVGVYGIASLSKLFLLCAFIHGIRVWRRMIHLELEESSVYEGPPLPIFRILPISFWVTRIIAEPVFLIALSIILQNFFVLQPAAGHFIEFAAVMLFMKQYTAWYMRWEFLRNLMDMRNAGPIIAKIVDNQASDDDLATMHLASTKALPEDLRRDFALHIAKVFSPGA